MNRMVNGELVPLSDEERAAMELSFDDWKGVKRSAVSVISRDKRDGGVTVDGMLVKTDAESLVLINGAHSLALRKLNEPGFVLNFKAASGWVELSAAQMIAVAEAVGEHIQACFSRRRELEAEIETAETLQALMAIDLYAGW